MHQDDRRRVVGNGVFDHFPWADTGTVNRALEQLIKGYELLLVVQQKGAKYFVGVAEHQGLQALMHLARVDEFIT